MQHCICWLSSCVFFLVTISQCQRDSLQQHQLATVHLSPPILSRAEVYKGQRDQRNVSKKKLLRTRLGRVVGIDFRGDVAYEEGYRGANNLPRRVESELHDTLATIDAKGELGATSLSEDVYGNAMESPADASGAEDDVFSGATATLLSSANSTVKRATTTNDDDTLDQLKDAATIATPIMSSLQLIIMAVFAYFYKKHVVDYHPHRRRRKNAATGRDFNTGLCGCFSKTHYCFHAFFCLPCRAAHTWQVVSAIDYWPGCMLQICCGCVAPFIFGLVFRPKIRNYLGHLHVDGDGCWDSFIWCCCTPCVAAQEALAVDEEQGIEVSCCCTVEELPDDDEPPPPPPEPEPQPQSRPAPSRNRDIMIIG